MPRTMKAAFVTEFGKPLTIGELPVPEPKDGQVLIRIEACGVCHTDVHAADGDWPGRPKPPFTPGHEGIGRVVAMGKGVKQIKEGDLVGVPWLFEACGLCDYRRRPPAGSCLPCTRHRLTERGSRATRRTPAIHPPPVNGTTFALRAFVPSSTAVAATSARLAGNGISRS